MRPPIALWGAFAAAFGVALILGVTGVARPASLPGGLALIASGVLVSWRRSRWTLAVLAAVALLLVEADALRATMTAHVLWASLALALFDERRLQVALRVEVAALYAFAGANKLFPAFLSGSIVADLVPWFPWPALLAVPVVAIELGLAVAILSGWRHAPVAVVTFHVPVALFTASDVGHAATLLVYGAMMWWVTATALDGLGSTTMVEPTPAARRQSANPYLSFR